MDIRKVLGPVMPRRVHEHRRTYLHIQRTVQVAKVTVREYIPLCEVVVCGCMCGGLRRIEEGIHSPLLDLVAENIMHVIC